VDVADRLPGGDLRLGEGDIEAVLDFDRLLARRVVVEYHHRTVGSALQSSIWRGQRHDTNPTTTTLAERASERRLRGGIERTG
jgi:hypothetical protein